MNHVALDYETTFSNDRDINKLGVIGYLRHPETDIYLVSMYGDGVEYVGPPAQAPWGLLHNRPIVAHNLGFDEEVSKELRRRGTPVPEHPEAYCTADMAACLQVKRDLGTATKVLENVILSKSTRSKMKNQTWETMTPAFREEALAYALDDAKASWLLWENHSHLFPDNERALSAHTRLMTARGLGVDFAQVERDVAWLEPLSKAIEQEVPWLGEVDAKGKEIKIGSPKRLRLECEKMGIPPPDTTDTKDERFGDWAEEYAEQAPFVAAIQQWRKTNRFLVWCEAAQVRSVDGRLRYSLKYCGAPHTRRWSGSSGVNLQNLAKKPLVAREVAAALGQDDAWLIANGVDPSSTSDMRGHLIPAPGHKFITADLSQIEPRVLAYLSGQTALLDLMRTGMDVYEAQARAMGLYSEAGALKDRNPALRQTVKVLNLGLGYGLGEAGLMRSYRRMSGKKMDAAEAIRLVKLYRDKNPEVVELWKKLKDVVSKFKVDGKAEFELPSGRTIRYYNVRYDTEVGLTCVTERGSPPKRCWSGRTTENCLAAGTPVWTDRGWVPIERVRWDDLVWDGKEWVEHGGVVSRSDQRTMLCFGVACTSDHLFALKHGWVPAVRCKFAKPSDFLSVGWDAYATPHKGEETNCLRPVYDILNAGPRHRFTVLGDFPMVVHNCVQGLARDTFAPMILDLEASGCPVVMHTHDELTCEVPEDRAEEAREHVTRVMSTSPEWAPGLPVAGVAGVHDRYEKD